MKNKKFLGSMLERRMKTGCRRIEMICSENGIKILTINPSKTTESKYYFLRKGQKNCIVRISTHPPGLRDAYDYCYTSDETISQLKKMRADLTDFFKP